MEIEVLVGGEDEREGEMGPRQGSSLNLRLRRRVNNNRERSTKIQPSGSGTASNSEPLEVLL